jgi:hypothetical protein
VIGTKLVFKNK